MVVIFTFQMSFSCVASLFAYHFEHSTSNDLGETYRCESDHDGKTFSLEARYDCTFIKLGYGEETAEFKFGGPYGGCLVNEDADLMERWFLPTRSFFDILATSLSFIHFLLSEDFESYVVRIKRCPCDIKKDFLAQVLSSVRDRHEIVMCENFQFYSGNPCVVDVDSTTVNFRDEQVSLDTNGYRKLFFFISWYIDETSDFSGRSLQEFLESSNDDFRKLQIGEVTKYPTTARTLKKIRDMRKKLEEVGLGHFMPQEDTGPVMIRVKKHNPDLVFHFAMEGFKFVSQETRAGTYVYLFS